MDEVRSFVSQWHCDHAVEIGAGLVLSEPHQVAAPAPTPDRSANRRADNAKGLTTRRPLEKKRNEPEDFSAKCLTGYSSQGVPPHALCYYPSYG
jgi:hypothetical protein